MQERPINSLQETVVLSDSRHQRAKIGRLRNQLNSTQRLPIISCAVSLHCSRQIGIEKKELWALKTNGFRMTNGRRSRASDPDDEREHDQGRASEFCWAIHFHRNRCEEDEDNDLESWFRRCKWGCRYDRFDVSSGTTISVEFEMEKEAPRAVEYPHLRMSRLGEE